MPQDISRKVKGKVLISYANFVKKKWGQSGLKDCEKFIKLDLATIQEQRWYYNQYTDDMLAWMAKNYGMDTCRQAGLAITYQTGIVSFIAKVAGVKRVLERGAEEAHDAFNFGELKITMKENSAKIVFVDMTWNKEGCVAWQGVFEGLLEITKTKGTVKKIACHHDGAKNCIYEMKWE